MHVRTIEPEELEAWVEAFHVPFFETSSAAEQAAYRRSRFDFGRTWGAFDDSRIVGTLRSFETQLTTPGGGHLTADAVTQVSVHPTRRRRGLMTQLIQAALRQAADRHDAVSILIAAEYPIYGRFGYGPATEHASYALDAQRARFEQATPGQVELVTPHVAREEAPKVFEEFRRAQPGAIGRLDYWWDEVLGLVDVPGRKRPRGFYGLFRDDAGQVQGFVAYHIDSKWEQRLPQNTVVVDELLSLTPAAYTALWRFCAELDLVTQVTADDRPSDEPLYWQLVDGRALRQAWRADFLWVRILDLVAALTGRGYPIDGRAVIDVADPLGYATGRFALEAGGDGAMCRPTTETSDVAMSIGALSAAYLGGASVAVMHRAGLIEEHRSGAVQRLEAMFATRPAPWCNTWF